MQRLSKASYAVAIQQLTVHQVDGRVRGRGLPRFTELGELLIEASQMRTACIVRTPTSHKPNRYTATQLR